MGWPIKISENFSCGNGSECCGAQGEEWTKQGLSCMPPWNANILDTSCNADGYPLTKDGGAKSFPEVDTMNDWVTKNADCKLIPNPKSIRIGIVETAPGYDKYKCSQTGIGIAGKECQPLTSFGIIKKSSTLFDDELKPSLSTIDEDTKIGLTCNPSIPPSDNPDLTYIVKLNKDVDHLFKVCDGPAPETGGDVFCNSIQNTTAGEYCSSIPPMSWVDNSSAKICINGVVFCILLQNTSPPVSGAGPSQTLNKWSTSLFNFTIYVRSGLSDGGIEGLHVNPILVSSSIVDNDGFNSSSNSVLLFFIIPKDVKGWHSLPAIPIPVWEHLYLSYPGAVSTIPIRILFGLGISLQSAFFVTQSFIVSTSGNDFAPPSLVNGYPSALHEVSNILAFHGGIHDNPCLVHSSPCAPQHSEPFPQEKFSDIFIGHPIHLFNVFVIELSFAGPGLHSDLVVPLADSWLSQWQQPFSQLNCKFVSSVPLGHHL